MSFAQMSLRANVTRLFVSPNKQLGCHFELAANFNKQGLLVQIWPNFDIFVKFQGIPLYLFIYQASVIAEILTILKFL